MSDKTLDELHEAAERHDEQDVVTAEDMITLGMYPADAYYFVALRNAYANGTLVQRGKCPTCGSSDPNDTQGNCSDAEALGHLPDRFHSQQTEPKPTLHAHRSTQPVCPTCGSDDPKVRDYTDCSMDEPAEYLPCGDHWHDDATLPTCTECGGSGKDPKYANWTPEQKWTSPEYQEHLGRCPTCHGTGTEPTQRKADTEACIGFLVTCAKKRPPQFHAGIDRAADGIRAALERKADVDALIEAARAVRPLIDDWNASGRDVNIIARFDATIAAFGGNDA